MTENLIGVLLVNDLVKSTMVESRELLSVQSPLSALCADLKRRYLPVLSKNASEALLVEMTAGSRLHRGQGIYRAMRL